MLLGSLPLGHHEQTWFTLRLMRAIARKGKQNQDVRRQALALIDGLRPKDYAGEVARLWRFVRDRIRYVRDIHGVETLHDADVILRRGSGDCDDKSILLAALLESIGHPARFVAMGVRPGVYSHVYPEARVAGQWVPLETTVPGVPLGWAPPNPAIRATLEV